MKQDQNQGKNANNIRLTIKILLTVAIVLLFPLASLYILIVLTFSGIWGITILACVLLLPLTIPLIWIKKRKKYLIGYLCFLLCSAILFGTQYGIKFYNESITIDMAPAININEYLPFQKDSKIIKLKSKTLSFRALPQEELPVIDGAAAAFPVYSAFVNAVYPNTTRIYENSFQYNNTVDGYQQLAERLTDIFVGAAPSADQISCAKNFRTTFKSTQIGSEAFVFFVHKNNPVKSLTIDQIKGIYSGKIKNWSEVGGKDEEIIPFQRNEGSGSQSMLVRFMGDTPLIEPTTQTRVGGMGGIISEVADYKNKTFSIGFSFRFYVEEIIKNPNIKMISVEDVAPTAENIKNNTYPIITPVYAVTFEENKNPNVQKLIDWMLSDEGQYIIEETGYVGVKEK